MGPSFFIIQTAGPPRCDPSWRHEAHAWEDAAMSSDGDPPAKDVVLVHSPSDSGEGYRVLRLRDSNLEVGEIRSMREGAPIHGEVVKLSPRKEHERLFDVEVLVPRPEATPALPDGRTGPAQVATAAYRTNWELIFGGRDEGSGPAN
jgi:hypothetical protein